MGLKKLWKKKTLYDKNTKMAVMVYIDFLVIQLVWWAVLTFSSISNWCRTFPKFVEISTEPTNKNVILKDQ